MFYINLKNLAFAERLQLIEYFYIRKLDYGLQYVEIEGDLSISEVIVIGLKFLWSTEVYCIGYMHRTSSYVDLYRPFRACENCLVYRFIGLRPMLEYIALSGLV